MVRSARPCLISSPAQPNYSILSSSSTMILTARSSYNDLRRSVSSAVRYGTRMWCNTLV